MIDLDKLQGMWEKDSKIDNDNLHTESLNIPSLHAKYFELYNTIFLMRKKAEQQRKNIRHERYEYFSGKADPDVYVENPFPKKKVMMKKLFLYHSSREPVLVCDKKHIELFCSKLVSYNAVEFFQ